MIECPFCGESIEEEEFVYEFNWGDVATYFYNRKQLLVEPRDEYKDRSFYVTFKYDGSGNPRMDRCDTVVNREKHPSDDPMRSEENDWDRVVKLLSGKKVFEVLCTRDDRAMPVGARILPLTRHNKKGGGVAAEGESTGMFCPLCEQHLKPDTLKAKTEIRILLSGRPGCGKTVYVTQAISELKQGRLAKDFDVEAANHSVESHFQANKQRLKSSGKGFVLANNPGAVQEPYIYILKNKNNPNNLIRLVIQDIAGEDTNNRTKYSKVVRKADMLLYFIDPWHIEEMREFHKRNADLSNTIVERSTNGNYSDLSGVFSQMMSAVDRSFTQTSGQLAGLMLVKGDYLNPPMLAEKDQPECEMMRRPINFNNPVEMEFTIGMRSSFVRQSLQEWDSTRSISREVESKYSAHNTRYFVSSALGQSTHLRENDESEEDSYADQTESPDDQFSVGSSDRQPASGGWNYGEQFLETPARPMNVIDPIFWCLERRGIQF